MRPWAGSDGTAFLVVSDQRGSHGARSTDTAHASPPSTSLSEWVALLSQWGYRGARTNAIGLELSSWFAAGGFAVSQQLALLQTALGAHPTDDPARAPAATAPGRVRSCPGRIGPLVSVRPGGLGGSILEVDAESFPERWAFDECSLHDALRATPTSRIFHVDGDATGGATGSRMAGFLIVGLAGRNAYIQRLAVRPAQRRSGVARILMHAAMRWSRSRGCTHAVVNTEVDNVAALALYEGLGFRRMSQDLNVLEMSW